MRRNGQRTLTGIGLAYQNVGSTAVPRLIDTVTGIALNAQDVIVVDRVVADTTVSSTAAATPIYTVTIPGGLLETNRRLRVQMQTLINDTNGALSNRTLTLVLKYGGSTVATGQVPTSDTDGAATVASLSGFGYMLTAFLAAQSESAQNGMLNLTGPVLYSALSATPRLLGTLNTAATARGTASIDSTVDQTFQLTAQWSVSSAQNVFTMESAILELV